MRILICDDDAGAADLLARLLRTHGHEVRANYDGRTCVQEALQWRPAVAFLDLGMPDVDGYRVATALRRDLGADIVIVAVTAWDGQLYREQATRAGFDIYLVKPVDIEQVLAIAKGRAID
jgi:CheY-like chemotaxis protein